MQTYSGANYWPCDPRPEEVYIVDIAEALSKQSRFGGHCLRFFSVAEHSILMARKMLEDGFDKKTCLTALLHDGSEAYLVDVPRPLKAALRGYKEIELLNMEAIATRFGIHWPFPPEIKHYDDAILGAEREQNMRKTDEDWNLKAPPLDISLKFWDPTSASCEFLATFHDLNVPL